MLIRLRGPLADYELRHWAEVHSDPVFEPVGIHDEIEARSLLRTLLAYQPSFSLRALVAEFEGVRRELDEHELIAHAARLIARARIRVSRAPLVVMPSEPVERIEYEPHEPIETEIEDTATVIPLLEIAALPAVLPEHQIAPLPAVIACIEILEPPTVTALIDLSA